MKKKIFILLAAAAVISAVMFTCTAYKINISGTGYYTQIDNSRLEKGKPRDGVIDFTGTGGMNYSYTLLSYDADGKSKDITFGTYRKLRQDAFICLTVAPVRDVTEWKEVKYAELPPAVQKQYRTSAPKS